MSAKGYYYRTLTYNCAITMALTSKKLRQIDNSKKYVYIVGTVEKGRKLNMERPGQTLSLKKVSLCCFSFKIALPDNFQCSIIYVLSIKTVVHRCFGFFTWSGKWRVVTMPIRTYVHTEEAICTVGVRFIMLYGICTVLYLAPRKAISCIILHLYVELFWSQRYRHRYIKVCTVRTVSYR